MVNQDPQPEVFETTFTGVDVNNTNVLQNTVYTLQGHNEQFRVYAVGFDVVDTGSSDATPNFVDFDITISAGPNNIPTNSFDGGFIMNSREKVLPLSCPVLLNFKQPLQVKVENVSTSAGATSYDIIVRLIGETCILKR
jgi:hypothetical protein